MTPVFRMPDRAKLRANLARLPTCVTNCRRSSASPIAEPPPVGGHTGATSEPDEQIPRADPIGEPLQVVVARVDADVRIEQKQVHAVELHAVDRRVRGQVQHRVEVDRRLRVRALCRPARATSRCGGRETCVRGRMLFMRSTSALRRSARRVRAATARRPDCPDRNASG